MAVTSRSLIALEKGEKVKVNLCGEELIKRYEELRLKAYLCPAKIPSISYGVTRYENGSKVKLGDEITKERAEELFRNTLEGFEKKVERLIKVPVNENQFSALVSFSYNVGIGNLKTSTLLKKLNSRDYIGASNEFERWIYSNGKKLEGLRKRRKSEKELFLEGV